MIAQAVLLKEIVKFKSMKPWLYLTSKQVFIVVVAEWHEEFWCVVQPDGLVVYVGEASFLSSQCDHVRNQSHHELFFQKAMFRQCFYQLSFEDKQTLNEADLNLLSEHQLRFRGAKQWPMMRYYHYQASTKAVNDESMVRLLAYCVSQATLYAKEIKASHLHFPSVEKGILTVVVSERDQFSSRKDSYLKHLEKRSDKSLVCERDVQALFLAATKKTSRWVVYQYYKVRSQTLERKEYEFITIIYEEQTRQYDKWIVSFEDEISKQLWKRLSEFCKRLDTCPHLIVVDDERLLHQLSTGCEKIGIQLIIGQPDTIVG